MTAYWITDPRGHRILEQQGAPADGLELDTPFGKAVVINTSVLMGTTWICDLCNGDVLIDWGQSSWPVLSVDGYGLCIECTEKVLADMAHPYEVCPCPACVFRVFDWAGELGWEVDVENHKIIERRTE